MKGFTVAVMSAVAGNGAKYNAVQLAKEAVRQDNKVLLIDFDFNNPYLAVNLVEEMDGGLDHILSLMPDGYLKTEVLEANVQETSFEADLLLGTKIPMENNRITAKQVEGILLAAKLLYDKIIVVVSPNAKNAATPYVLLNADRLVLVARRNHANVGAAPRVIRTIEQYYTNPSSVQVVYNYHSDQAVAELNEQFALSEIPIEIAGALQFDPKTVDHVDFGKKGSVFSKSLNEKEIRKVYKNLMRGDEVDEIQ